MVGQIKMGCNLCASKKTTEITPQKTHSQLSENHETQPKINSNHSPIPIIPSIPDSNPVHQAHNTLPKMYPDLEDMKKIPSPTVEKDKDDLVKIPSLGDENELEDSNKIQSSEVEEVKEDSNTIPGAEVEEDNEDLNRIPSAEVEEDNEDSNKIPSPEILNQVLTQNSISLQDLSNYDSVILVIGDSGSGKSSYINLIHNFINDNTTLESLRAVTPTEKWPDSSESYSSPLSQFCVANEKPSFTKEIRLIELNYSKNSKKLLLVDTPGFCRSDENPDVETANMILSFIQEIKRLDYVFYVHRSDYTKFETSFKETFSLFGQTFQELCPKIIAIYTFAGSKLDVKHDSLPFPKHLVQKKYHTINNTTFDLTLNELVTNKKRKHVESLLHQNLSKLNSLLNSI